MFHSVGKRVHKNVCVSYYRTFSSTNCIQSNQATAAHFLNDVENVKPFEAIPGPSVLQLIVRFLPGGAYHGVKVMDFNKKLTDEYGGILRLPGILGNDPVIQVTDPKDFEFVLRNEGVWPYRRGIATFNHYRKNIRPDVFQNMGGLISESGEAWGKMRTAVNPIMLKPATVNAYTPVVDEISVEFCDRIKSLRDSNNELPAKFLYELNKWSLESIASIAVNQRLHVLDIRRENDKSPARQLIQSVDDFFTLSYQLEMLPSLWRYISTPKYKQLMETFETMTNTTLHYIDEAITKLKENPPEPDSNREPSVFEKLVKLDKHYAIIMALDMFLAGVDTTSSSMSNFLYHLAKNPEKQEKLRDEIKKLPLDENGKLLPTSFLKAPYLRACLKEVMRLAPIVAGTARALEKDIVLKGYHIPKGTDIVMANVVLHKDEKHFKHPNEFMPERWLKENVPNACPEAKASNPFVYLPFGFGVRSCVGRRFAEMEINVLITRILKQFRVEYNYGPLEYRQAFVLSPISDLKFKMTEI